MSISSAGSGTSAPVTRIQPATGGETYKRRDVSSVRLSVQAQGRKSFKANARWTPPRVPVSVLIILIFRRKMDWRWVGAGAALAAAAFLPYAGCGMARYGPIAGKALGALSARPATFTFDSFTLP